MGQADPIPWLVEELVPHAAPMILIDDVLECGEDMLKTRVLIHENSMFYCDFKGVPSWAGVEYMAQTVAALAGVRAKKANKPIRVGFLVGARRYECAVPMFPLGQKLDIIVRDVFADNGMGVFDCEIQSDQGEQLATARLNVYLPQDVSGQKGQS